MKWSLVLIWFAVLIVAMFYDRETSIWVADHRVDYLSSFMLFLTDSGLFWGILFFIIALFEKHLVRQILLIALAFVVSLEASFLLKMLFEVPRPYETWDILPLKTATGYAFPSMHAAFIFAALPFFRGRLRKGYWFWALFASLIAASRVYVGVHYVSDVVAGGLLGYLIGWGLCALEEKHGFTDWLNHHIKDQFEVRRQIAHTFIGVTIIFLYVTDAMSTGLLLVILVAGAVISALSMWVDLPGIKTILDYFERPHHRRSFPGRGAFFMVLGALISLVVFPEDIALAAIAIMALGDSVTNIFGRYFGEVRLFYNPKKTVDGVLMGIVAATLAGFYFVPLPVAFAASCVAMFLESMDLKFLVEIDDNILVPLVAGGVMVWIIPIL